MADDIFILGIKMTKFGKHPDLDTVDLAAEAAQAALKDGGVTMKDMGILAAGNLMGAGAPIGQMLQKQIGQTGIPVFNVSNACATGATALRTAIMAIKAGECDMGLAVGVEKLSGAGLLGAGGGGGGKKGDKHVYEPQGRQGTVMGTDGRIGTQNMPGTFAQIGMEYGHKYGGTSFELFAKISEKNHAHSTLNPLAAYTKKMTLEEIMGDMMIAYPNTRPMCSANCDGAAAAVVVSDAKLQTLDPDQRRRAVKVSASILTSDRRGSFSAPASRTSPASPATKSTRCSSRAPSSWTRESASSCTTTSRRWSTTSCPQCTSTLPPRSARWRRRSRASCRPSSTASTPTTR